MAAIIITSAVPIPDITFSFQCILHAEFVSALMLLTGFLKDICSTPVKIFGGVFQD